MGNINHLSEQDIFNIHYKITDKSLFEQHLTQCSDCRLKYEKFANDMNKIAKSAYLEPAEDFFNKQRKSIMDKIDSDDMQKSGWLPAFPKLIAGAAALIVIVVTLTLVKSNLRHKQDANLFIITKQDIDDDDLLMEIEDLKELPSISGLDAFAGLDDDEDNYEDDQGAFIIKNSIKV